MPCATHGRGLSRSCCRLMPTASSCASGRAEVAAGTVPDAAGGTGLDGMRERVAAQGGELQLLWQPTGGMLLTAWMPNGVADAG